MPNEQKRTARCLYCGAPYVLEHAQRRRKWLPEPCERCSRLPKLDLYAEGTEAEIMSLFARLAQMGYWHAEFFANPRLSGDAIAALVACRWRIGHVRSLHTVYREAFWHRRQQLVYGPWPPRASFLLQE